MMTSLVNLITSSPLIFCTSAVYAVMLIKSVQIKEKIIKIKEYDTRNDNSYSIVDEDNNRYKIDPSIFKKDFFENPEIYEDDKFMITYNRTTKQITRLSMQVRWEKFYERMREYERLRDEQLREVGCQGTRVFKNGVVDKGEWKNGSGNGILIYSNGTIYGGNWKNDTIGEN